MSRIFRALIVNGANTNLYGVDPSGVYGAKTLADIEAGCRAVTATQGLTLDFRQSNHEGQLIDWIHAARQSEDGIIINAGSLTYTSIGLLDALSAFAKPVIEVHMTNIYRREPFRHHSFISKAATGIIAGLGPDGYELAVMAMARLLKREAK
ncbi:3-dehydroquinate dehydratase [Nordella sp. HKS 07]|uniref:type II 3-dehydroquinate dehydratase n=1 Tax=Nordella sp. HKS 07 TaxID=2712222 RepID=UPI0013E18456|nr:type II 3-dehydroquinate dehydratase [Nordella sp. HKS 07]QIG47053.1 3-dehydroquinate dehydratase [Nordella sp. HKS 07]